MITHTLETKIKKTEVEPKKQKLRDLYQQIRHIRQNNLVTENTLIEIFETVKSEYPNEWLLPLEIYELAYLNKFSIQHDLREHLNQLIQTRKDVAHLIEDGIRLSENPVETSETVDS
jgi:phenylalanine-4-hydroxylase